MALHAQARKLARHGRIRTRRPLDPVPRSPNPQQAKTDRRSRRLGTTPQPNITPRPTGNSQPSIVAAPARQVVSSSALAPPEQPIAPISLPSSISGTPPAEAMTPSRLEHARRRCAPPPRTRASAGGTRRRFSPCVRRWRSRRAGAVHAREGDEVGRSRPPRHHRPAALHRLGDRRRDRVSARARSIGAP